jgi:hypothetical protein
VKNGCLERPRHDIRTDGSRIEGVNRGLNQLQHSYSCSIGLITWLVHDFVLRRNIRVTLANKLCKNAFLLLTFGCHHLLLVDHWATLFNQFAEKHRLTPVALFPDVLSNETFGLVTSEHILSGDALKQETIQEYSFDDIDGALDGAALEAMQEVLARDLGFPTSAFSLAVTPSKPCPSQKHFTKVHIIRH